MGDAAAARRRERRRRKILENAESRKNLIFGVKEYPDNTVDESIEQVNLLETNNVINETPSDTLKSQDSITNGHIIPPEKNIINGSLSSTEESFTNDENAKEPSISSVDSISTSKKSVLVKDNIKGSDDGNLDSLSSTDDALLTDSQSLAAENNESSNVEATNMPKSQSEGNIHNGSKPSIKNSTSLHEENISTGNRSSMVRHNSLDTNYSRKTKPVTTPTDGYYDPPVDDFLDIPQSVRNRKKDAQFMEEINNLLNYSDNSQSNLNPTLLSQHGVLSNNTNYDMLFNQDPNFQSFYNSEFSNLFQNPNFQNQVPPKPAHRKPGVLYDIMPLLLACIISSIYFIGFGWTFNNQFFIPGVICILAKVGLYRGHIFDNKGGGILSTMSLLLGLNTNVIMRYFNCFTVLKIMIKDLGLYFFAICCFQLFYVFIQV